MAQPLRKIRQRIAPAVPKGGFSFTLPPLAAGAVCIVMLACIGWAFFMGYMVGHGQNPGEEMRELTGIGRPDRETLAEMDKAMAGSEDAGLRDKLADNTAYFRAELRKVGLTVPEGEHPIVPVMLGDARVAGEFAARMLEKGVYVVSFSYPVVPKGKARIRTQVSAGHSREDLDFAVSCFREVKEEMGL